jgi:hypothetical protein
MEMLAAAAADEEQRLRDGLQRVVAPSTLCPSTLCHGWMPRWRWGFFMDRTRAFVADDSFSRKDYRLE